jgi:PKD repeat protein
LDGIGNYNLLQIYDQPSNPYFHCHFQGGTGVGNNVTFQRGNWYWVTIQYAVSNALMQINFYDTTNNYALLGSSTGAVAVATTGCRILQLGCVKYASGGSQSVDYDNFIINTNGVFPLGPGPGGSFLTNQAPVAMASATPTNGVVPLTVVFSSVGSSDPEGASLTYLWNFGDGATDTTANPAHVYASVGNFAAQLTVSDGTNSATAGPVNIAVSASRPAPPQNLRIVGP